MRTRSSDQWIGALAFGSAVLLGPTVSFAQAAPPSASAPVPAPPALIREYFVVGNTVLSPKEVERAVYPFLGPNRTVADIEAARSALEKAIQAKGFKAVFVEVPPQSGQDGVIRLQVTQTPVGQVKITGVKADSQAARQVREAFPSLAAGQTPNLTQFSTEVSDLNSRSADRQVTPELAAGAAPGTVDVDLKVDQKSAWHGSAEINNQYNADTTKLRVAGNLRYDNLWGRGDSLSFFTELAPENLDDAQIYVLSYGAHLGQDLRLDVTALQSNSDVATVGDTDVLGNGHSVEATLTKVLPSTANATQSVAVSLAYKDFKENVTFGSTTTPTPISYFPVGVSYIAALRTPSSDLTLDTSLKFAFRGTGDGLSTFDNKRAGATGGFAYVKVDTSWRQDLPDKFEGFLRLSGQMTSEPLISNEEFAAGGANSVRGYLESEVVGDDGFIGSLELRSPPWRGLVFDELRAIGFVDGAVVRVRQPLAGETSAFDLVGVGVGLRAQLKHNLVGDVDFALPLTDAGTTRADHGRIHFRVSSSF
jgi:hemolysin activation/secretion protein